MKFQESILQDIKTEKTDNLGIKIFEKFKAKILQNKSNNKNIDWDPRKEQSIKKYLKENNILYDLEKYISILKDNISIKKLFALYDINKFFCEMFFHLSSKIEILLSSTIKNFFTIEYNWDISKKIDDHKCENPISNKNKNLWLKLRKGTKDNFLKDLKKSFKVRPKNTDPLDVLFENSYYSDLISIIERLSKDKNHIKTLIATSNFLFPGSKYKEFIFILKISLLIRNCSAHNGFILGYLNFDNFVNLKLQIKYKTKNNISKLFDERNWNTLFGFYKLMSIIINDESLETNTDKIKKIVNKKTKCFDTQEKQDLLRQLGIS